MIYKHGNVKCATENEKERRGWCKDSWKSIIWHLCPINRRWKKL